MTLLDASIIIERLRARDPAIIRALTIDGAVCGVTRAEILSGARNDADRQQLVTILAGFQQVSISHALWDDVGAAHATLRAGGLTVPMIDVVLAIVGMAVDCEVWTLDAHFRAMQRLFPRLKLRSSA